jgi:hypothetical protein
VAYHPFGPSDDSAAAEWRPSLLLLHHVYVAGDFILESCQLNPPARLLPARRHQRSVHGVVDRLVSWFQPREQVAHDKPQRLALARTHHFLLDDREGWSTSYVDLRIPRHGPRQSRSWLERFIRHHPRRTVRFLGNVMYLGE